jgi:hypothetical protein
MRTVSSTLEIIPDGGIWESAEIPSLLLMPSWQAQKQLSLYFTPLGSLLLTFHALNINK